MFFVMVCPFLRYRPAIEWKVRKVSRSLLNQQEAGNGCLTLSVETVARALHVPETFHLKS